MQLSTVLAYHAQILELFLSQAPHKPGMLISAYISSRTWKGWESGLERIRNSRLSWLCIEYITHLYPPTPAPPAPPHLFLIYIHKENMVPCFCSRPEPDWPCLLEIQVCCLEVQCSAIAQRLVLFCLARASPPISVRAPAETAFRQCSSVPPIALDKDSLGWRDSRYKQDLSSDSQQPF